MAKTYFSHPRYLKAEQGRPVVFVLSGVGLESAFFCSANGCRNPQGRVRRSFQYFHHWSRIVPRNPPDPAHIRLRGGIFGYDVYVGDIGLLLR
jgi:hypothetical protein